MAATKMKITRESGAKEYPVLPATIVDFEEHFSIPLGEMKSMTHLYWLAWSSEFKAAQKAGAVAQLFEDWILDVTEVEEVSDDGKRPTGGRSRSSSPQSA